MYQIVPNPGKLPATGINDQRPRKKLIHIQTWKQTDLSEQHFVSEWPVDIRRVEERDAECHCPVEDFDHVLVLPRGAVDQGGHAHAPQPDGRNLQALRSKLHSGHGRHSWRNSVPIRAPKKRRNAANGALP